jgi:hypothetical protein
MLLLIGCSKLLFGTLFHARQLMGPVTLKGSGPLVNGTDRLRIGAIKLVPAIAANPDQVDIPQYAKMLRYRRLIELHGNNQVSNRQFAGDKKHENLAPAGLCNGVEGIGSGSSSRHEKNITCQYGNMSSAKIAAKFQVP